MLSCMAAWKRGNRSTITCERGEDGKKAISSARRERDSPDLLLIHWDDDEEGETMEMLEIIKDLKRAAPTPVHQDSE